MQVIYTTYYDAENTNIKTMEYYENDRLHREGDKPASIYYFKNGTVESEVYFLNGNIHRDGDKPAMIYYNENGYIESESYHINDRCCRDGDKPAIIQYYPSESGENIKCVIYKNNKCHREDDKPAIIKYYKNGNIKYEKYFVDGQNYRDGPNRIDYSEDGDIVIEIWLNEEHKELKRNVINFGLDFTKPCQY